MSRIGKQPVVLPASVKADLDGSTLKISGPKGKFELNILPNINVKVEEKEILVTRANDEKESRSLHGLTRQLINNMVIGVSEGYKKVLLIVGVGYKAEAKNNILTLSLGYANDIEYMPYEGVKVSCESATKIIVEGISKERVGQVAAEIRSLRKPEPYKGKGIKYEDEHIRSKSGKAGRA